MNVHASEALRLTAVHRAGLVAGQGLSALDELTRQAARLCGVPIAAIALFEAARVRFPCRSGLDLEAIDRTAAPCDHPALGAAPCVIADLCRNPGLADNPLVTADPNIRFYAGAPLIVGNEQIIGCLCVMDVAPREMDPAAVETLSMLAKAAAAHFDVQLRDSALHDARASWEETVKELRETSRRLTNVQRLAQIGTWDFMVEDKVIIWSDEIYEIFGVARCGVPPTTAEWKQLVHPDDRERMTALEGRTWDGLESEWDIELRIVRPDGGLRHIWLRAEMVADDSGRRLVGTVQDITDRKRMEAELNRAVTDMAMAGELAKVGAWSVDLERGTVNWSDEIYAIHEMPVGTTISIDSGIDYFAPETRERSRAVFEACARDGVPFDEEQQLVTATGKRIWVRGIGMPVRNAEGRIVGVRGAFQDIDALKRSEQEVRRLAERLEATLESITEGFLTVDRDWRFTYLNAEAARSFGQPREDLLGKNMWDTARVPVNASVRTKILGAMRDGVAISFEDYYAPANMWFNVRVYPSSEGLAIYFQNVTEARNAIDALRESEARFKLAVRATADTIWDHDVKAGTLWWSDDFATRLGHDPGEFRPSRENWWRVVHPDDVDRVTAIQREAIAGGSDAWDAAYRMIRRDGAIMHVLDRAFLMRDADGRVVREIGGLSDVSQRVEYEERLHQAQRLESVGHLTGGIAHDFNNLLTVILGNAELLTEDTAGQERQHRLAQITMSAAQRGADLTSRLLAFARRQTLHPQAVNVDRLIAGMHEMLRRTIGGAVEIEIRPGEVLWSALADPAQLESAILNLCINARDAMPQGGRLVIETANTALDEDYVRAHEGVAAGPYVMVAVSDTGSGMPAEVVAQAFEPFFTTKGVGKGSGLGLSVIYGFVRQSGGHVTIESEVDAGTTVRLYLPPADAVAVEVSEDGGHTAERGGTERVLVVEDDDLVRDHVTALLTELGYSVAAAANGPEALAILREGAPFDLLFTDVVMPGGMNGRQVADAARKLRPALRVLFTSGYTDDVIGISNRIDRGIHLISKPYRRWELAGKLRQVLDEPS